MLVHGKLQGKKGNASKDVSGIACAVQRGFPRGCLVIDDNLQATQFVKVEDGEIQVGDMMPLIDDRFRMMRSSSTGRVWLTRTAFSTSSARRAIPVTANMSSAKGKSRHASERAVKSCVSGQMAWWIPGYFRLPDCRQVDVNWIQE
jgi:hypothetical protein